MSMTSPMGGPEDEIDLTRLAQAIWVSRYWMAACGLLGLFCAAFYIANTQPTFQADTLLQLEARTGSLALPTALSDFVDSDPRTVTEMEIIRSRLIIGEVVAELNLDWTAEAELAPLIGTALLRYSLPVPDIGPLRSYGRKGDGITLALLEVPPQWVDHTLDLVAGEAGAFTVTLPDGSELQGQVGTMLRDAPRGLALKIDALTAPAGRHFIIRQMSERTAIDQVRAALTVAESGRQSGILTLRFNDQRRDRAVSILNGIAESYVRQNIDRSAAEAASSLAFIEEQLPIAKARVDSAETALNAYRQAQLSVDLTFETENVLTQVTKVEADLSDLQTKEDEIKQLYKTSHPVYQQLLAQRARLQKTLEDLQAEVGALPETQREVVNLTANLELTRKVYTELLTRAQEVRVLKASSIGNVRIIDDAVASLAPVAPRKSMILAAALMLGLVIGAGIGITRIWLRKTVQGTEALEKMGLSVFATINLADAAQRKGHSHGPHAILAISDPTDLAVEGLRSLRTSLQFGMLDARTKSITITSTAPGAGKSFSASNLAVVSAQAGQRVCLIDADLRRGQLRKLFDGPKHAAGLSEYLAGEKTLDEVIHRSPVDGMDYIPSGRFPPNPSELLMRKTLDELVADLDRRYDLALFDCPPVLAVTDPVVVGRATGGVLAVVRYDQTPLAEVSALLKTFEAAGLRLTGTILNGFDPRKARAGGYSYNYNYNYRYDYKRRAD
jgi:tyrosine-protein kinase Etk/Wzc